MTIKLYSAAIALILALSACNQPESNSAANNSVPQDTSTHLSRFPAWFPFWGNPVALPNPILAGTPSSTPTSTPTSTATPVPSPSGLVYAQTSIIATKGTAITTDTATVTGTGITFSISPALPSGLVLNTTTGAISGNPAVLLVATTFTITATNSGGYTTTHVTITVKDVAPSLLHYSTTPATYIVGTAIVSNNPLASGGAIVSYSISATLPTGLSFSTTTGIISGTPTTVTSATNYTVTATNTGGSTTAVVNITVHPMAPAGLSYSSGIGAIFTKGTLITPDVPTSTGGAITSYSISPTLPAGLALSATTGQLSGTPTVVTATTTYTITGSNATGSTITTLFITVKDIPPAALVYAYNPVVYTKSVAITANTATHTGGAVVSYATSPALPSGISLNTTTGTISGTPAVISAATNYTITATNSGGSTTKLVSVTVHDTAPAGLNYSTNPATYTVGATIANNVPSSTGGAIVSYAISPALPSGLALNTSTGVISGTPTAVHAAATYTITATNTGGTTTKVITITVNNAAPTSLSYSTNPATYTVGTTITNNTPSSAGGAVTSYAISPGLSAGLSFNTTTGVISGNPTAAATAANHTITASNAGGSTTVVVSITVNASTSTGGRPNGYTIPAMSGTNVMTFTVNGSTCSSYSYSNKPCVSVKICTPGTSTCQTINDILLDTGSYGLRVFRSVITAGSPAITTTPVLSGSSPVAECVSYGDGSQTWGSVVQAGVGLGGETPVTVPIQLIDQSTPAGYASVCPSAAGDVSSAGYNGILGVGLFQADCGSTCVSSSYNGMYFSCSGGTCTGTTVSLAHQVQNPVALLPVDNNGVIIKLPNIPLGGVASTTGYMVLGIGTQTNNTATGVTAYTADPSYAQFSTTFAGTTYSSFLDTGTNVMAIPNSGAVPTGTSGWDSSWYCPSTPASLTATNISYSGVSGPAPFQISNYDTLSSSGNSVFIDEAYVTPSGISGFFDWGIPFFYGRNTYIGIQGKSSTLGSGPLWAY